MSNNPNRTVPQGKNSNGKKPKPGFKLFAGVHQEIFGLFKHHTGRRSFMLTLR